MLGLILRGLKFAYRRSTSPFARRALQLLGIVVWIGKLAMLDWCDLYAAWDVLAVWDTDDVSPGTALAQAPTAADPQVAAAELPKRLPRPPGTV